jgi:hypothetical protein
MLKVSELEGETLDLWVARALGYESSHAVPDELCGLHAEGYNAGCHVKTWSPSTDCFQGDRIIEHDGISTVRRRVGGNAERWAAFIDDVSDPAYHGPTRLIAAMRCKVARHFGDERRERGEKWPI